MVTPVDAQTRLTSSSASTSARFPPAPAVLLRNDHAEESHLPQLLDDLARELALAVVALGDGRDLAVGEFARRLLDHPLLFGQRELHGILLWKIENAPGDRGLTPDDPPVSAFGTAT